MADGSTLKHKGKINLTINYGDESLKMTFVVLDQMDHPAVNLGTNWLRKSGAILQSRGNRFTLSLGGKKEKWYRRFGNCPSPLVVVDVDGVVLEGMIDTGATICSVGKKLVRKTPTAVQATIFDGSKMKFKGTVSTTITYEGKSVKLDKVFVDKGDSLILGMEVVHKFGLRIAPDGNKLIVSRQYTSLYV